MNNNNRSLQIERILLREEARRKRLAKDIAWKPELKMMFYRDIFSKAFPGDPHIWERIEKRRSDLLKHGYFDQEGNVTDKGLDALIRRVVKIIRSNPNRHNQLKIGGR